MYILSEFLFCLCLTGSVIKRCSDEMFKCPGEERSLAGTLWLWSGVDSNSQSESEPWQELAIVGSFYYKHPAGH